MSPDDIVTIPIPNITPQMPTIIILNNIHLKFNNFTVNNFNGLSIYSSPKFT